MKWKHAYHDEGDLKKAIILLIKKKLNYRKIASQVGSFAKRHNHRKIFSVAERFAMLHTDFPMWKDFP